MEWNGDEQTKTGLTFSHFLNDELLYKWLT